MKNPNITDVCMDVYPPINHASRASMDSKTNIFRTSWIELTGSEWTRSAGLNPIENYPNLRVLRVTAPLTSEQLPLLSRSLKQGATTTASGELRWPLQSLSVALYDLTSEQSTAIAAVQNHSYSAHVLANLETYSENQRPSPSLQDFLSAVAGLPVGVVNLRLLSLVTSYVSSLACSL